MQKWEYKVITVFKAISKDTELNALGEQGWELVEIYVFSMGLYYYFKRPKP
jgi:Domain of unknown function (DUF4177)